MLSIWYNLAFRLKVHKNENTSSKIVLPNYSSLLAPCNHYCTEWLEIWLETSLFDVEWHNETLCHLFVWNQEQDHYTSNSVKFRYCEKATKFEKISHSFWNYLVTSRQSGRFFSNFCGLLRISELYQRSSSLYWNCSSR